MEKFPHAQPNNPSYISIDPLTNESCSKITEYYAGLYRPINDNNMPWPGQLISMNALLIWYWCADQAVSYTHLTLPTIYSV